jgi:5-formyltetrahydrofolate cyclo-ligase
MMAGSKPLLRTLVKSRLQELTVDNIRDQSQQVFKKLQELNIVSSSSVVCVYISMNNEIVTPHIIHHYLNSGNRLFIPKVVGKGAEDMVMFRVKDIEQLESFPKNSWGIPEPPLEIVQASDPNEFIDIDVILLPGVAFDKRCNRIGHGKGYYGKLLRTVIVHCFDHFSLNRFVCTKID